MTNIQGNPYLPSYDPYFDARRVMNDCIDWFRKYFDQFDNNKNCCVAISGGKDSSVVAALAVAALGKERVKGILLPQYEQSDIDCSLQLVKHLDIEYKIVNIGECVDNLIMENKRAGINITEQALINLPARMRMAELYFYAACVNGIPTCNCNLSEDHIGYSTFGGDGFGSFGPISQLTTSEVRAIGYELRLPRNLIEKTPSDGLCGQTDEDRFGFTYEILDCYIRTGYIENQTTKEIIDTMHKYNDFKLKPMPVFPYGKVMAA